MRLLLIPLTALLLTASASRAQTVLPSGAVAPAGAVSPNGKIITPGTVPGSQPYFTPAVHDGGRPRVHRRDEEVPGMTRQDRKHLRKLSKVRPLPAERGKATRQ